MPRYKIITLIDITRTGATKNNGSQFQLNQQHNFNSLRQAIELRSNVYWYNDPIKLNGQLPNNIEGKSIYWTWEFDVERDEIFLDNNNPVKLLLDDLNGVPIIPDLENNSDISPAAIQTYGKQVNTWAVML